MVMKPKKYHCLMYLLFDRGFVGKHGAGVTGSGVPGSVENTWLARFLFLYNYKKRAGSRTFIIIIQK